MLIDVGEFLWRRRAFVDDDNRITIHTVCDGTLLFLTEMVLVLKKLGCTDIQATEGIAPSELITADKPWCNYVYAVSGVLPSTMLYDEESGILYIDNPPGQERTEDWERYKKDLLDSAEPCVYSNGWPGWTIPVEFTENTGTQYIDTGYVPEYCPKVKKQKGGDNNE